MSYTILWYDLHFIFSTHCYSFARFLVIVAVHGLEDRRRPADTGPSRRGRGGRGAGCALPSNTI